MEPIIEGEIQESLTPMPTVEYKPQTMSFPDAIKQIILGHKVTRISWGNKDFVLMKDEWLSIFTKDAFHTLLVSQGDIEGNDWTLVKESN